MILIFKSALRGGGRIPCHTTPVSYTHLDVYKRQVDSTTVKMTTEKLSDTPYETIYEDDPTLAPGTEKVKTTPYTGHKVRSYRNLYDGNGNLISSTLEAVSDYKSRNKVILRRCV